MALALVARWLAPLALACVLGACSKSEPAPAPSGRRIAVGVSMVREDRDDEGPPSAALPTATPAPDASAADAAEGTDAAGPVLLDNDGAVLLQTDAMPSVDTPTFRARIDLLWQAIVDDAPDRATPAFFPRVAYEQVKAIPHPAADWTARLLAAFARDVHRYHRELGPDPHGARFIGVDVPMEKARWVVPGEEGNKVGYDRVLRSKLRFTRADGRSGAFDLTSMISWRGEWYVVHLAGFK